MQESHTFSRKTFIAVAAALAACVVVALVAASHDASAESTVLESSSMNSHLDAQAVTGGEETEFSEAVEQADVSSTPSPTPGCTNTPGWKNKWKLGCDMYAKAKWCKGGKPLSWIGRGEPAKNCCVCGKDGWTTAKGDAFTKAAAAKKAAAAAAKKAAAPKFRVASKIGDRAASTHYKASVRAVGSSTWKEGLVLQSISKNACKIGKANLNCNTCGYWRGLDGWTQSWLSFELNEVDEVEIKLQRLAKPISRARIHPAKSGAVIKSIEKDGSVVIRLTKNARFHVDVDGGMDDTDTIHSSKKMHTMAVFANPMLEAPDHNAPNTLVIRPEDWKDGKDPLTCHGGCVPKKGTTVVFTGGEHRPPQDQKKHEYSTIPVFQNVHYFFSYDAIMYAALYKAGPGHTKRPWGGWLFEDYKVTGYGTISGEEMSRLNQVTGKCTPNVSPTGIKINGSKKGYVSGLTFVDFPTHHIILQAKTGTLTNVKVLGWRANGDGTHVFGKWQVDKQFYRTQDDSLYLDSGKKTDGSAASTFTDITVWNDANGAGFIVGGHGSKLLNSHAIYRRAEWQWWGAATFTHRAMPGADTSFVMNASSITVENFTSDDPLPSMNTYQLVSMPEELAWNKNFKGASKKVTAIFDIKFKNVKIAKASTIRKCMTGNGCNCAPKCAKGGPMPVGFPNVIHGYDAKAAYVRNIHFDGCTIDGVDVKDMLTGKAPGYFNVTGAVSNIYADGKKMPDATSLNTEEEITELDEEVF